MRIGHEKFRGRNKTRLPDNALGDSGRGGLEDFKSSFADAIGEMKELEAHIEKAIEDLNPLRVLTLFKAITASDCELLGLDPGVGRPEEFLWQYISVPPVCIRPSVQQEAAT
jgi:DNA-directed RNA polymerase III subunit RPC1